MNNLSILVIFICTIVIILISVLIRNRKDKKEMIKSMDASDDEAALHSIRRPGERKEL